MITACIRSSFTIRSWRSKGKPALVHRFPVRSIRTALGDLDVERVHADGPHRGGPGPGVDWSEVQERRRLPGMATSGVPPTSPDLTEIADGIVAGLAGRPARTFRIAARRADKRFPTPSPEIERIIGQRVKDATGWPVNLSNPEFVIRVEIVTNDAFFYFDKHRGPGGLPIGTSGRVACLLSGGIDSPVAAWRMIKRGCRVQFVHFHSYPVLSRTSQEKARKLVEVLTRHQLRSRLFLVPFVPIQQQIVTSVPPALRVVLYRRLMVRIAQRLGVDMGAHAGHGRRRGAGGPQTLENLAAVERAATMPCCGRSWGSTRKRSRAKRSSWAPTRSRSSRMRLLHAFYTEVSATRATLRPSS